MEEIEQPNQERINASRKRKLHGLENTGSGHHQSSDDERKNKKRVCKTNEKTFRD